MKIKVTHALYTIDILTMILILIIVFLPDNVLRIIIGLPFVLFFPGYTLIAALFPRKSDLDSIEKVALSFGLSIAVVPLIGLVLNYTPWGIRLNSILTSLSIFILVMSIWAWFRQRRLLDAERPAVSIHRPLWGKQSRLNKILSVVLVIAILAAIGTLGYAIAKPKAGEKFTEFYILGANGTAEDYPPNINLGNSGSVTLGIVNHKQAETSYTVEIHIDGVTNNTIGPLVLQPEEKYENPASFTPQKSGDNQEVEFLLYKNGQSDVYLELHLWVSVK